MKAFVTKFALIILFATGVSSTLQSQVELVPVTNTVYDFLDRMLINKVITGYSSSMKPVSRREVANYLSEIKSNPGKLSRSDKKSLEYYLIEFNYDINRSLYNNKNASLFSDGKFSELFKNKKQKYLLANSDSNYSLFLDGIGEIKYIGANGDSLGKPHIALGQIGLRIRGTLFNSLGYYLRLSNAVRLSGGINDAQFAAQFDPMLASTRKFISEGSKTFDSYEGYLRYTPGTADWFSITAGREALKYGTGFLDKLVLSQNTAPFDFVKVDIAYKKIKYSFMHSSIVGQDSSDNQLDAKYLVVHRLEVGPMINGFMKLGFNEMLVYSNVPLNFAFLNPLSFLTSADLNTEVPGKNSNNTIIEIDAQFFPARKVSLQASLLIDDLNFETLGKTGTTGNDNKFGFQAGLNWQDAFTLPNLNLIYEFTRIDPFVYAHRQINNSYSNWNQPLGVALNSNSDEHAVKLAYNFGTRLMISLTFKHQRSGMNITDSLGNMVTNVGSNILNGSNDFQIKNVFLNGLRVDKNIIIAEVTWQPIRQYYFSVKYQNRSFNYISQSRKISDSIFWGSFRVDY